MFDYFYKKFLINSHNNYVDKNKIKVEIHKKKKKLASLIYCAVWT